MGDSPWGGKAVAGQEAAAKMADLRRRAEAAIDAGDVPALKASLDDGLDPDHWTMSSPPLVALRGALDAGLDPGHSTTGGPPLAHHAAASGNVEALRVLLDAGADPEGRWPADPECPALLCGCLYNESTACLELLLARGADPDGGAGAVKRTSPALGRPALIAAIGAKSAECVRICLAYGASPDAKIAGGRTAAMMAMLVGDAGCMRELCEFGFDESADDDHGMTAWDRAARRWPVERRGGGVRSVEAVEAGEGLDRRIGPSEGGGPSQVEALSRGSPVCLSRPPLRRCWVGKGAKAGEVKWRMRSR